MEENIVSKDLVEEYIHAARQAAKSSPELSVIREAEQILREEERANLLEQHPHYIFCLWRSNDVYHLNVGLSAQTVAAKTSSWNSAIVTQLHLALCTKSTKYAKEVKSLKDNARLLIAAIAGYVAAFVGVAVAVIAALVAALLRLITSIGISAFCQQFSAITAAPETRTAPAVPSNIKPKQNSRKKKNKRRLSKNK